ncbi:Sca4 family protein [Candidatus Tisiphia endosymbiont of Empis tessellata]|uniref:Sca4 family protein n=1 Tax=Candidatus Tisiphia endosymbiont of Empis tessellata TaxID=3066259 RepID=UPI00313B10F5
MEKLQIKPEAYEVGIQTDKIAGKSIGTETETITKEFRAVDSQTDNRQKLYQSVGTEYRPVMDSGVSVDKVLVQDKTKGNVYDDDKILQDFKELSREQVQPIVNKFSLQSTSSFAQFAQENVGKLSEAFRDSNVLREIENIEQRGYTDIHKKFAAEYKDIAWQENIISPESGKSFNLKQNGKDVVTINETTLSYDVSHDDKNAKYKTREGEEIKNARMVNIPLSIDMQGACHMSFAVQDTNGRNISKEDAVYLTAHYKNGKLVHLTKPTEIFSCSDDNKSPLYLKRKGKTYTLPVDKRTLEQLEQEVLKNKGEYVGIVKNAQGNIRVNSAAVHGLQPDCVTADPLFKDASLSYYMMLMPPLL